MPKRLPVIGTQAPVALLALLLAPNCLAAWKFTPTLDLRETYTDNVSLTSADRAQGRFVSEVTPGFTLLNNSPRLKARASYQLHYFPFADADIANTTRSQSQLAASLNARLIDEFMFFDAAAAVSQQAVSAFGPQVADNAYSNANRTEVRTYRISPYFKHSFNNAATAELRYVRDSVDAGRLGPGSSDSNNLSLNLASGPAFSRLGWGMHLSRQQVDEGLSPSSTIDVAGLNLSYALTRALSLTANAGYDKYDYQALGGTNQGKSWKGGFVWVPSSRTSLQASAGRSYYGPSYLLSAQHRSRHTVWSINYNDAVTTTRAQFLLPVTIDTAALLDRLFSASIADPVAREAAVAAYMRATGLPASLADNVNYFSNRFMLQKQLQASAAFNTARTTSVLTVFETRRQALSTIQSSSLLLGDSSTILNENTTQRGVSALWNWRMNSRTGVNLSLTAGKSRSNTTFDTTDNRAMRLALTHQFKPKLRGALEARRSSGTSAGINGGYRENALSASLSMQY